MVHTFIIGIRTDKEIANRIRKSRQKFQTMKKTNDIWRLKTTELWQYGIDEIQLLRYYAMYFVRIIINPAVVLFGCYDLGVVSHNEIIENCFEQKINQLLKSKLDIDLKINDFSTRYIDYAFDHTTEYVEESLRLLHRGKCIYNMNIQNYRPNESYYCKSKSVNINWYNKKNQLKKLQSEGIIRLSKNQMDWAENVLRLEIQCMPDKIKSLKKKHTLSDTNPMNLLRPEIAMDVVSYYFKGVAGDSDFYSFTEARKTILKSTYNK